MIRILREKTSRFIGFIHNVHFHGFANIRTETALHIEISGKTFCSLSKTVKVLIFSL